MTGAESISVHDPSSFTDTYMQPRQELEALLQHDFNRFFIVPLQDMYRLVHRPVPASRATTHTCIYLTEGESEMKIGSEIYRIGREELLFVPAGQVFSFRHAQDINKGFICVFHEDMLFNRQRQADAFEFLKIWGQPRVTLDAPTAQLVLPLFTRLLQAYTQQGLAYPDLIQTYLMALLCEVNLVYRPNVSRYSMSAINITRQFRELLFSHVCTKHRVSDYAAMLHITPSHLNKTIKAVTNKPPIKWIDEAIIQEAKVLLNQCDMTVHEVALALGLEDPSYFTRLFKKQEGCTPTEFRKMMEKSWNAPLSS